MQGAAAPPAAWAARARLLLDWQLLDYSALHMGSGYVTYLRSGHVTDDEDQRAQELDEFFENSRRRYVADIARYTWGAALSSPDAQALVEAVAVAATRELRDAAYAAKHVVEGIRIIRRRGDRQFRDHANELTSVDELFAQSAERYMRAAKRFTIMLVFLLERAHRELPGQFPMTIVEGRRFAPDPRLVEAVAELGKEEEERERRGQGRKKKTRIGASMQRLRAHLAGVTPCSRCASTVELGWCDECNLRMCHSCHLAHAKG